MGDLSKSMYNFALQHHLKYYMSTTKMPIATKLGKIVTYHEGLLPIKSHDFLIMCTC